MPEPGIEEAAELIVRDGYWNPCPVDRAAVRAFLTRAWAGSRRRRHRTTYIPGPTPSPNPRTPWERVMRDLTGDTITDAVIATMRDTKEARLAEILDSLVRHLHDFVRDVEPTEEEWARGIDFLTRTGQTCTPTRQEFILLSDVLGVTMLVDALSNRRPAEATQNSVLGPFFR
ncbi:dioxygenase, partial [Streptomyces sp. NPDC005195]|uniref:dioxygenase n=1 Tax=Streptomyces sp. NPDC005195 TaxID=3154561 RepID=UPI0033AC6E96